MRSMCWIFNFSSQTLSQEGINGIEANCDIRMRNMGYEYSRYRKGEEEVWKKCYGRWKRGNMETIKDEELWQLYGNYRLYNWKRKEVKVISTCWKAEKQQNNKKRNKVKSTCLKETTADRWRNPSFGILLVLPSAEEWQRELEWTAQLHSNWCTTLISLKIRVHSSRGVNLSCAW